jgi:hypothetical protein
VASPDLHTQIASSGRSTQVLGSPGECRGTMLISFNRNIFHSPLVRLLTIPIRQRAIHVLLLLRAYDPLSDESKRRRSNRCASCATARSLALRHAISPFFTPLAP